MSAEEKQKQVSMSFLISHVHYRVEMFSNKFGFRSKMLARKSFKELIKVELSAEWEGLNSNIWVCQYVTICFLNHDNALLRKDADFTTILLVSVVSKR